MTCIALGRDPSVGRRTRGGCFRFQSGRRSISRANRAKSAEALADMSEGAVNTEVYRGIRQETSVGPLRSFSVSQGCRCLYRRIGAGLEPAFVGRALLSGDLVVAEETCATIPAPPPPLDQRRVCGPQSRFPTDECRWGRERRGRGERLGERKMKNIIIPVEKRPRKWGRCWPRLWCPFEARQRRYGGCSQSFPERWVPPFEPLAHTSKRPLNSQKLARSVARVCWPCGAQQSTLGPRNRSRSRALSILAATRRDGNRSPRPLRQRRPGPFRWRWRRP